MKFMVVCYRRKKNKQESKRLWFQVTQLERSRLKFKPYSKTKSQFHYPYSLLCLNKSPPKYLATSLYTLAKVQRRMRRSPSARNQEKSPVKQREKGGTEENEIESWK